MQIDKLKCCSTDTPYSSSQKRCQRTLNLVLLLKIITYFHSQKYFYVNMENFMDKDFAFVVEGALSGPGLFLTASKLPEVTRYY